MNKLLLKSMFIICIAVLLAMGSVVAYAKQDDAGMDLSDPEEFFPEGEAPVNGTYEPSITADGKSIYFAQFDLGDEGNPNEVRDIWVSHKKHGKWQPPERLPYAPDGTAVNSPAMDTEPMINAAGNVMILQSNRAGGPGTNSNNWIVRKDRQTGEWGVPEVLGAPFNTTAKDHCLILTTTTQGEIAYWASKRKSPDNGPDIVNYGGGDIYYSVKTDGVWGPAQNMGDTVNDAGNQCRFVPGKGNLLGIVTDHDANHHQEFLVRYDPVDEEWVGPRIFAGWNFGDEGSGSSEGCGNFTTDGKKWLWSSGRKLLDEFGEEGTYIFPGNFDVYWVKTEAMLNQYEDETGHDLKGTDD